MAWQYWPKKTGINLPTANLTGFFSLRKLNGYTGSAIRVIRDSDLTTQDIGFDINGLLDTAAINTFCSGTTGRVNRWYNQVDNTIIWSQATQANQPIIYQSGSVVTVNSLPAVLLDLNDRLIGGDVHPTAGVVGKSVFIVYKMDSIAGGFQALIARDNLNVVFAGGTNAAATGFGTNYGGFRAVNTLEDTNQNQGTAIITFSSPTTTFNVWTNGANFATNSVNTAYSMTWNQMGYITNNFGLRGKIQEVIIYNSDKSTDRALIELFQTSFWM